MAKPTFEELRYAGQLGAAQMLDLASQNTERMRLMARDWFPELSEDPLSLAEVAEAMAAQLQVARALLIDRVGRSVARGSMKEVGKDGIPRFRID